MKRFASLLIILVFLFTTGCEDEVIINPADENEGLSLTITGLPDVITAPRGSVHNLPVKVVINRADGTVAAGMRVGLSTSSQAVTANPGLGDTDGAGNFETTLNIVMPEGSTVVQVTASCSGISTSASLHLTGTPPPDRITLTADATTLTVPFGQSGIINLNAVVTDSEGVGVPGVQLDVVQYPDEGETDRFGALTRPQLTDTNGQTSIVFNSHQGFGGLVIHASTDIPGIETVVEAEIAIRIIPLESEISYFIIAADPAEIVVAPDQQGTSTIRAQVMDSNRNGIPNLRVNFTTNLGSVNSSGITDRSGTAEVAFVSDFQYGQAVVTAAIPSTDWLETVQVMVRSDRPTEGTLEISSPNRGHIYADNGFTFATITAVLKDDNGQCLPDREIVSSSTFGVVTPSAVTDSLGRAVIVFADTGQPSVNDEGESVPAVITISYPPFNLEATLSIYILPLPPLTSINLRSAAQQMIAGSLDSTSVRATAYLENGMFAPNGTLIHFSATYGTFTRETVVVQGNFGTTETFYIAGNGVGVDTLHAYWINPETDERVYSNEVLIRLLPGSPERIELESDRYSLMPGEAAEITATVSDANGYPVRQGTFVSFAATSGSITMSSTTDEDGRASATYSEGNQSGIVEITAFVSTPDGTISDTIRITVDAGLPNVIILTADPTAIPASGGGITWSSTLRVIVHDASGNPVDMPTTVVFELLNQPDPPAGCNINGNFPSDSVQTVNGVAQATLNSGTQIGGVLVRAYTWRDSMRTDTVSVILASIAVVSGPPFQLGIDINSQGEDAGGGAWVLEVSARVWDVNRNPVEDGIPVIFTVDPEVAGINHGYTGNQNRSGQSNSGVAYAELVYHSVNTFDDVLITAEVAIQEGMITNSRELSLPLQRGIMTLYSDPEGWLFEEGHEEAHIRCWVILTDGHNVLINNAPILFTSNRAGFYWYNFRTNQYEEFYPDPARKLTGINDNENIEESGQATVFLVAEEPDIFLDPFTLQTTVSIYARVEGYNDVYAQPRYIQFTRHG